MAILHMDSFDHYTTATLGTKWFRVPPSGLGGPINDIQAVGRRGTKGLRLMATPNTGNSGAYQKTLSPIGNTVIVGAAVRWTGLNGVYYRPEYESPTVFGIRKLGGMQVHLLVNPYSGGILELHRGYGGGQVLVAASSSALATGTMTFIELKVVVAPGTSGSVELRLNGSPVMTLTGLNTAATGVTGWDMVQLGAMHSSPGTGGAAMQYDYDDVYILDGSGDAPWNNFIGDCRVEPKYVTAEGTLAQWTPSTGTDNAAMIDETTPDDDTTTVSSVTPGDTDTYVMQDAEPGAGPTAIQLVAYLKKATEGLAPTFGVIRVGSPPVDYMYPMENLGTTYQIRTLPLMLNPDTGLPWTEAEFNAAEFGFSRG